MRIISSFVDYYDCIQRVGYDPYVTYVRETKYIDPVKWPVPEKILGDCYFHDLHAVISIGFCGKFWPLLNCYKKVKFEDVRKLCLSNDEVVDFLGEDAELEWFSGYTSKHLFGETGRQLSLDPFIKHKTPIIIYDQTKDYGDRTKLNKSTIVNPKLKEYGFAHLVDPYTAFQEIEMFLGNMAQEGKPIPRPDDDTMRDIKGFDKWSFRKCPKK